MDLQFRSRNHDFGAYFPTFQERVNSMLPVTENGSTAPAYEQEKPQSPHLPSNEEINMTLAQVEQEAIHQSEELIQLHSGLNEQKVARLLGLLE